MTVLGSCLHRIRASLHSIAQDFGFTGHFTPKGHRGLKERNNSAYFRLKKISCEFKAYRILLSLLIGTPHRNAASRYIHSGKEQARARPLVRNAG